MEFRVKVVWQEQNHTETVGVFESLCVTWNLIVKGLCASMIAPAFIM